MTRDEAQEIICRAAVRRGMELYPSKPTEARRIFEAIRLLTSPPDADKILTALGL